MGVAKPRLGIDLGGTKIAAIVIGKDGETAWEHRVPTPRESYEATIEAIANLVAMGEQEVGAQCTIGIGMPGAISPATRLVKNANSTWLNGRRFGDDVERRLNRDVRFSNDANCLAVSEANDGAGKGAQIVFGVIIGTGVGGGIAIDGRALRGANAIAGEWGHNPLPWPRDDERPGPLCYCGRQGCIESFLSGPAVALDFEARTGRHATAEAIHEAARCQDAAAVDVLNRWTDRLARALATVINVVDPHVIVIGGGLSKIDRIYTDVPERWSQWVFSDKVTTRLVKATFGDASGVRGAAFLW